MSTVHSSSPFEKEYAWGIATLYPEQGAWTEQEYLEFTDGTRRMIEFTDGRLEFLPMPTEVHQELVEFLFLLLRQFVDQRQLGKVHSSGLRVRIRPGKIREPDVLFLHKDNFRVRHNRVWDGADLVMEVVSGDPKDRQRDYEQKLLDYAEAKIAEYWIVDFERKVLIVHRLDGNAYCIHGEFTLGQQVHSSLLQGFTVDVTALFALADNIPE